MRRLINFTWRVVHIPGDFIKCIFRFWRSENDYLDPPEPIDFKTAWGIAWAIHFMEFKRYLRLMWVTNCFENYG
jgi:hypothetical protein